MSTTLASWLWTLRLVQTCIICMQKHSGIESFLTHRVFCMSKKSYYPTAIYAARMNEPEQNCCIDFYGHKFEGQLKPHSDPQYLLHKVAFTLGQNTPRKMVVFNWKIIFYLSNSQVYSVLHRVIRSVWMGLKQIRIENVPTQCILRTLAKESTPVHFMQPHCVKWSKCCIFE